MASLAGTSSTSSSTDNVERFSSVTSCWRDRNESIFGICFLAYTKCLCPFLDHIHFPLYPFDIQKVSGDKFVIHFLDTAVGARGAIVLGQRPSLLLQHLLCPSWEEGPGQTWSATATAVTNSIPLTSHFSLLPFPAPAAGACPCPWPCCEQDGCVDIRHIWAHTCSASSQQLPKGMNFDTAGSAAWQGNKRKAQSSRNDYCMARQPWQPQNQKLSVCGQTIAEYPLSNHHPLLPHRWWQTWRLLGLWTLSQMFEIFPVSRWCFVSLLKPDLMLWHSVPT